MLTIIKMSPDHSLLGGNITGPNPFFTICHYNTADEPCHTLSAPSETPFEWLFAGGRMVAHF